MVFGNLHVKFECTHPELEGLGKRCNCGLNGEPKSAAVRLKIKLFGTKALRVV